MDVLCAPPWQNYVHVNKSIKAHVYQLFKYNIHLHNLYFLSCLFQVLIAKVSYISTMPLMQISLLSCFASPVHILFTIVKCPSSNYNPWLCIFEFLPYLFHFLTTMNTLFLFWLFGTRGLF